MVLADITPGTYYDKEPLTPVNLKREHARLRRAEAERLKEGDTGEDEEMDQPTEEAEQSEERSNPEPADGDATHDDSDASSSSPSDQASPKESDPQES